MSSKRVLIVTYYWPPSGGSGVQRWLKFSKYLPQYGWQPVVVAPENADYPVCDESLVEEVAAAQVEVLRVPIWEPYALYRKLTGASQSEHGSSPSGNPGLLKRLSRWVRANFFVPDPRVMWVRPTVAAIEKYLATASIDAVVTTGPPHSVHLIGKSLKEAHPELPWIMDVRDPWSQFDVHLAFGPGARARHKNERLERECLAAADRVIGTSYSMPTHLEPFDRSKYTAITNGYDAADFEQLTARARPEGEKFHLYHTGLLNAVRNPEAVWQALARMVGEDAAFAAQLHIYLIGTVAEEVVASLARLPALAGKWTVEPWMSHDELVLRYGDADAFLLCPNQSDNAKGQINGKLFEYLAMRRPVLHVGPYDSDNTLILDEAHAGLTVPPGDVDGCVAALRQLYTGHFTSSAHSFQARVIERFEREETAGELVRVLEGVGKN